MEMTMSDITQTPVPPFPPPTTAESAPVSDVAPAPAVSESAPAPVSEAVPAPVVAGSESVSDSSSGSAPAPAPAPASVSESAAEGEARPDVDRTGMHWYAVHVAVGFETQVSEDLDARFTRENLRKMLGEILVPTEKIESLAKPRKGREPVTERKLYPGYLFIQMLMNAQTWHLVKNTRRVTGFIGGAREEPAALPEGDIEDIRERIAAGQKPTARGLFEVRDMVRVKEGPFSDFTGTVESVLYDRRRLTVSVMVFGRATPVELAFGQVEKV